MIITHLPTTPGRVKPPPGLLVVVGLTGVIGSVGAAASGFLQRLDISDGYMWGDTMRIAAIFALAGGVLAVLKHEVGVPIVIGSSTAIVAVVGTTLASLHLKWSRLLDPFPIRGGILIGAGVVAAVGVVLGLFSLRGRASMAFSIPIALLALGSLAATAGLFHLDKSHTSSELRPFFGYVLIAVISIICSFVGRHGAIAAAVASTTIVPLFIDVLDFHGSDRGPIAVADVGALAAIVVLAMAATAVTADRAGAVAPSDAMWGEPAHSFEPIGGVGLEPTAQFEATPYPTVAIEPVAIAPVATELAAPEPSAERIAAHQPTEQFAAPPPPVAAEPHAPEPVAADTTVHEAAPDRPAVNELSTAQPTGVVEQQHTHDVENVAVSTVGQWAADPYGRHQLRYWDGVRWTEHAQSNGVSAIDPV